MSSAVPNPATSGRLAHGVALVTLTPDDRALDAWFPAPALGPVPDDLEPLGPDLDREDAIRGVRLEEQVVQVDLDSPPVSVPDAYLRLHLLSHRLAAPPVGCSRCSGSTSSPA